MEPTFLYPSHLRLLLVPLIGLMGIAMSIGLIFYTPPPEQLFFPLGLQHGVGWFLMFCSALWVVGGIINFFHRACFLKLDADGLTASWLFLAFSLKWDNVQVFRTFQFLVKFFGIPVGQTFLKVVVADVFNVAGIKYSSRLYMGSIGYLRGPEAYASQVRAYYGSDAVLITNYGLSAADLASLLNEWRVLHTAKVTDRQG